MAMATINPATGETEFEAELHTPAEVEARLAKAQEAHGSYTSFAVCPDCTPMSKQRKMKCGAQ